MTWYPPCSAPSPMSEMSEAAFWTALAAMTAGDSLAIPRCVDNLHKVRNRIRQRRGHILTQAGHKRVWLEGPEEGPALTQLRALGPNDSTAADRFSASEIELARQALAPRAFMLTRAARSPRVWRTA